MTMPERLESHLDQAKIALAHLHTVHKPRTYLIEQYLELQKLTSVKREKSHEC